MRNMCEVKLVVKKQILNLNKTIDQLAKANGVSWYGHVLRKDKNNIMRRSIYIRVKWTRKRGRPKKSWLRAVVEQTTKVGQNESDAINRSRWRLGVNTISSKIR